MKCRSICLNRPGSHNIYPGRDPVHPNILSLHLILQEYTWLFDLIPYLYGTSGLPKLSIRPVFSAE